MKFEDIRQDQVLRGALFPEPVQVIIATPMGTSVRLVAKGFRSSRVYQPILTQDKLALLESSHEVEPFDGDPHRFRLGIGVGCS